MSAASDKAMAAVYAQGEDALRERLAILGPGAQVDRESFLLGYVGGFIDGLNESPKRRRRR